MFNPDEFDLDEAARIAEETAAELGESMLRNPLAQRFIQRYTASGDNRVHSAEDVLGERLMRLGALIRGELHTPGTVLAGRRALGDKVLTPIQSMVATTILAIAATPYLWTEEIRVALRGLALPRHVISPKVLPQPRTWHTFETGIEIGGDFELDGHHYVRGLADALLISDAGYGMEIALYGSMEDAATGEQKPCVLGSIVEYGKTFPDDFEEGYRQQAESALSLLAFLNSPYIPKQQMKPSRGARREAARAGKPIDDQLVTFLILRRPTVKRSEKSEEPRSVEWKHQWLVNGHARAQWYPSEQAHHVIWIAPYMKGPKDAPLLEHAYKVAR